MAYHRVHGTFAAVALLICALCFLVSTSGTKKGWFTSSFAAGANLKTAAGRSDSVHMEFGATGVTIIIDALQTHTFKAYSDLDQTDEIKAIHSGASASLAFSILAWLFALTGFLIVILSLGNIRHLSHAILLGVVCTTFVCSLLAWTVFLGVINANWDKISQVQTDSADPSWAWAFSFIGFITATAATGAVVVLGRNSDHHHHQDNHYEHVG